MKNLLIYLKILITLCLFANQALANCHHVNFSKYEQSIIDQLSPHLEEHEDISLKNLKLSIGLCHNQQIQQLDLSYTLNIKINSKDTISKKDIKISLNKEKQATSLGSLLYNTKTFFISTTESQIAALPYLNTKSLPSLALKYFKESFYAMQSDIRKKNNGISGFEKYQTKESNEIKRTYLDNGFTFKPIEKYFLVHTLNNPPNYDYFLLHDFDKELKDRTSRLIIDFNNELKKSIENQQSYISDIYMKLGSLHQKDIDIFNEEYLKLLRVYKKDLDNEINDKIKEAIDEVITDTKDKSFKVLELLEFKQNLTSEFLGLEKLPGYGDDVEIVYPGGKGKGLYLKIKARIRFEVSGFRKTTNVTITLKDFKIRDLIHLQRLENGRVKVTLPPKVSVGGRVDIDFSNSVLNFIVNAIEGTLDPLSKRLREEVAETLAQEIKEATVDLQRNSANRHGDKNSLLLPEKEKVVNKDEIVNIIEDTIFDMHLPFASMAIPVLKEKDERTWKDYVSIKDQPLPEITHYSEMHDGAIWIGTFLTSMALKANHTSDNSDIKKIETLLDKIEILATINGKGPLARSAFPKDSPFGKRRNPEHLMGEKVINGETWVALQGESGISRDQYVGIMTGLINTYLLLSDESIKERAKAIYKHLFDYLLENDWMIFDDSKRSVSFSDINFPTTWAGIGYQKVTYIMAAHKMFPENESYKKEYDKYVSLVKLIWINSFMSGMEAWEKYYSNNLEHSTLFSLALLTDEPRILRHLGKAIETLHFYTKFHNNPYFESIRYYVAKKLEYNQLDPHYKSESYIKGIETEHNDIFYRVHTMNKVSEEDMQYKEDVLSIYDSYETISGKKVKIANQAVPSRLRFSETNFLWQRSPFYSAYTRNYYNDREKASGLDIHILHWLKKYIDL